MTKDVYADAYEQDVAWKQFDPKSLGNRLRLSIVRSFVIEGYLMDRCVLDVGCGTGFFMDYLEGEFPHLVVDGLDVTDKGLMFDRDIFVHDIQKPVRLSKKYDLVLCLELLEHLDDPLSAVENMGSLLSDRGRLLISSPFDMGKWNVEDERAFHLRRWSDGELEELLVSAGLRVVEVRFFGNYLFERYRAYLSGRSDSSMGVGVGVRKKPNKALIFFLYWLISLWPSKKEFASQIWVLAEKND